MNFHKSERGGGRSNDLAGQADYYLHDKQEDRDGRAGRGDSVAGAFGYAAHDKGGKTSHRVGEVLLLNLASVRNGPIADDKLQDLARQLGVGEDDTFWQQKQRAALAALIGHVCETETADARTLQRHVTMAERRRKIREARKVTRNRKR